MTPSEDSVSNSEFGETGKVMLPNMSEIEEEKPKEPVVQQKVEMKASSSNGKKFNNIFKRSATKK